MLYGVVVLFADTLDCLPESLVSIVRWGSDRGCQVYKLIVLTGEYLLVSYEARLGCF